MKLLLPLLLLALSACSTASLNDDGSKVTIVDVISPTDLLTYEHAADLQSLGMRSVEDCRNDLRNQAARGGATIVRITSLGPAACAEDFRADAPKDCFSANADSFRLKAK